jgi:hypothetical protein
MRAGLISHIKILMHLSIGTGMAIAAENIPIMAVQEPMLQKPMISHRAPVMQIRHPSTLLYPMMPQ